MLAAAMNLAAVWSGRGGGDRVVLQCGDAFVFVYEGGILRHRSALQNDRRGALDQAKPVTESQ